MNYLYKKAFNINGNDTLLSPLDCEYINNRTLYITGEITDELATIVNSSLRTLARESDDEDIIIYIQSPGGSVSAGLSIFDTIKSLNCDVCTVGTGLVASMGAFLLAAGTRGKRFGTGFCEILIHQPIGSAHGQASDVINAAKHIQRTRNTLNGLLAQNTGKSIEQIANDTDRDYIMSADEALTYGIIDHIGDPFSK